jgi:transposase
MGCFKTKTVTYTVTVCYLVEFEWGKGRKKLLFYPLKHLKEEVQNLQKGLLKHRDQVFGFLYNPKIPYDNNASERSIRPLKIKQKVSGGFRSMIGAQHYAILHSVADTARKNNQSPFVALRTIATEA